MELLTPAEHISRYTYIFITKTPICSQIVTRKLHITHNRRRSRRRDSVPFIYWPN